jgi:hypothetical protein
MRSASIRGAELRALADLFDDGVVHFLGVREQAAQVLPGTTTGSANSS